MKFFTDGSRINNPYDSKKFIIGWGAISGDGMVLVQNNGYGSNINAEIFAIRDLLKFLSLKQVIRFKNESTLDIFTDSKTSLQIIEGYRKDPSSYDITESPNYEAARDIYNYINSLKENKGQIVNFHHIRGHGKDETLDEYTVLGNAFVDFVATSASKELLESLKENK